MRPNISIAILLISLLFILQGCVEHEAEKTSNNVVNITDLRNENMPQKSWINFDSLMTKIPGKFGEGLPAISTVDVPKSVELLRVVELIPGVSNLYQSVKDIRDGLPPVVSKKPQVIEVDYSKRINKDSKQYESAVITGISKPLHLSFDSISNYYETVVKENLITIQHGDTIYPPLSFPILMPKHNKALPFGHHDYALFDIRLLDEDQELPSSFIRAIAKDDNGVIWLGTHTGGVISYDGHVFGQYTTSNGLSSDMVISLLVDSKSNIWIGTENGGVNLYDGKNITRFTIKQGLPSNRIHAILEDSEGNIWFATPKGASMFNGDSLITYTVNQGLISNIITSLHEDEKGNIWFGTYEGITKYNPFNIDQNDVHTYKFTSYTKEDGLASNKVLSIEQDNNGNMWFGTNGGGVSMFNGDTFVNYSIEQGLGSNTVLSIIEDSYNNLWFGTYGNGVTRFTGKSFSHYTTKEGLSDNYVRTLFDDDEGNLWVGTDGNGISSFIINSFTNFTTDQGLSNNLILSIFEDKENRMWFGSFEGGVLIYNEPKVSGQPGTFTNITTKHGLLDNTVASIIRDNNDNYWFGTYYGGVSMLDGEVLKTGKLKFTNYSVKHGLSSNVVRCVLQDNDGNIWFGTEGGATRFDGKKFVTITKNDGLGSNKVLSIYQDISGAIWFGTMDGGVSCLKNDTLVRYAEAQGLGSNTVWAIAQDQNEIMWFGTNGGGLTCFNGDSFKNFNTDDGLSNNFVYSLIIDNDNTIWAGTTRGLSQLKIYDSTLSYKNSLSNFNPNIINYGKMDGLRSIDFFTNSALVDSKNRLWWGTADALSMLNLNKYKSNDFVPVVNIDELLINNDAIDYGKLKVNSEKFSISGISYSDVIPFSNIPTNLVLSHNLNQLKFRFYATDWSSPNQICYQYMLYGYEKNWSLLTKNNIAEYRNIPPGNYKFMVRAMGKSDVWSKVTEYPFVIRSPFWYRWWALVIYFIILSVLIWLIIRWRVSIVMKQKIVLENLIYDRTKELDNSRKLAEQATIAKSQFIATMSHEIRTPLNAIMGLTHLAIGVSPNSKQEDYLKKIDRSAKTLLSLINDILDFSKIEAGKMSIEKVNFDLEIVINSVIVLNAQHASKKGLEFVININSTVPRLLVGDPLRLGQIITNLVSNAIKFTPSGEVIVNIDIDKKLNDNQVCLKIAVVDTGIGISENDISSLFDEFNQIDSSITRKYGGTGLGLTISKMLIELMDGHIWVESEHGVGSVFFFDITLGVQSWETTQSMVIPDELKGFNILICDNNPAALGSLGSIIKSFSLNVDVATSGEDAIAMLVKKQYELIIIDQKQIGLSGTDTILSIKKHPNIFPIKTILTHDAQYTSSSFKGLGIDGFLSKPNIPSVVIEQLLSVFGMGQLFKKQLNDVGLKQIQKSISGCSILLAEDNEINSQVVSELLANVGISVDIVENGEEATKIVKYTKYDLILMDLHMPIMDGYAAANLIRKYDDKIPIIAITADVISSIREKCNVVGINDIITKPINPNLMYNTLLKWICTCELTEKNIHNMIAESNVYSNDISITGLDSTSGLKRFAGNIELYKSILNKFIVSHENTCNKLRELMLRGDYEQAHIIIHTLKGESGNIGATKTYEQTKLVEVAILNKNLIEFEKEINILEISLSNIIIAISDNIQIADTQAKVDSKLIGEFASKLTGYLKSKNPKAFNILDELVLAGVDKEKFEAIREAINNEEIEKAISLLKKL